LYLSLGVACSGHGACVSMSRYFQNFGFSYGNVSLNFLDGGSSTWDAFSWFECICSSQLSAGFRGNPTMLSVGPK
jgi:hypothetical protein